MTSATATGAFPTDEPLTRAGRRATEELRRLLPPAAVVLSSPAMRCLQTAIAAGLAPRIDPGLAECDFGCWAGRTLVEINQQDPGGVRRWMIDASAKPHGGESLEDLADRVGDWLAAWTATSASEDMAATTVAITHGGFIRMAIAHVRRAPLESVWQTAVDPLGLVELVWSGGDRILERELSVPATTKAITGTDS